MMICIKEKLIKRLVIFAIVLILAYNLVNFVGFKEDYQTEQTAQVGQQIYLQDYLLGRSRPGERKLEAECRCRKNQILRISSAKSSTNDLTVYLNDRVFYETSVAFSLLTCDPYKVLRRGLNQKIIGISLYGTKPRYYKYLQQISRQIKTFYPEWTIRIYHDHSIDMSKICELECLKEFDDTGEYIDNLDFCDVNKMPLDLFNSSNTWSAGYLHAMKWRWVGLKFITVHSFHST